MYSNANKKHKPKISHVSIIREPINVNSQLNFKLEVSRFRQKESEHIKSHKKTIYFKK